LVVDTFISHLKIHNVDYHKGADRNIITCSQYLQDIGKVTMRSVTEMLPYRRCGVSVWFYFKRLAVVFLN